MTKKEIRLNQVFGKLTIIKEVEPYISSKGYIRRKVLCSCECGNQKTLTITDLTSNKTLSCGCYKKKNSKELSTTHGFKYQPEYNTWANMKQRCNNVKNTRFADYGGRGIKVCERWMYSFNNFIQDMGKKPSREHSLDRIDNDGNYEPTNCRWATRKQQRINQRRVINK